MRKVEYTYDYIVETNKKVSFAIYELSNGAFYGRVMILPSKAPRNNSVITAIGGEYVTTEQLTKNAVLKLILQKLELEKKDVEEKKK